MSATILVTGASGNVGSPLVQQLLSAGHRPLLATRTGEPPEAFGDLPTRQLDFEHPEQFDSLLDGVDAVFLMRPPQIGDVQTVMFPFLEALKRHDINRVVLLSLLGAGKNPRVPHHALEKQIEAMQFDWTHLRPGFFMQNLTGLHAVDIQDRDEIFVPAGRGRTSFIDCRDIAAVAAKSLTEQGHIGKAYELTGSQALSYYEVAETLSQVLNRPIRYARPSLLRFGREMRRRGLPKPYVRVMQRLYALVMLGTAGSVTDELPRVLGREPISLAQFVEDHASVWQPREV